LDIVWLTEQAVLLASQDENLRDKIKDTVASLVIVLKNSEDIFLSLSIEKGEPNFIQGKIDDPNFIFETSKEDFEKLMSGKSSPLLMFASGKLKMTKGSFGEINKITAPLTVVLKKAKELLDKEE